MVHLANGLLKQARGRAAEHRLELVSQRDTGPDPVYAEYPDEPAEAEGVAHRIRDLIAAGVPAGEIAVLYRINAQSEVYEQALADAGVPYQLRGAERFFERQEVQKAILALRGAARSGGNDPLLDDVVELGSQVRAVLSSTGWTAEPPAGSGAVRDQWESLAALVRLAEDFARSRPGANLADLTIELEERKAAQHAPTVQGVTLASLHAAKGLEWDAVFLVGLTDGMVPITYAKTDEQVEEERRLLYVGVTRARMHLTLSWALSRAPGGRASRRPSRFLNGLRPGSAAPGSLPGSPADRAARKRGRRGPTLCRVCGKTLTEAGELKLMRCEECPSDMDEGLYERLRDWRAVQAKQQGLPGYCVFTDKTLMAIAEASPAEPGELSMISGVGARKLDRYGADVLAICAGRDPEDTDPDDA